MSGPPGLDPASADARFVVLYRDYHPLCYQVARSILRHHDQALDAVQEVFLQLLAGAPASLARALGPSFFRIAARNQAIGILRKRSVEYTALGRLRGEQERAGVISFPGFTAPPLLDPTVQRFLAGLPALRARVFELCYGLGFSSREAAQELGVSQKAVEKQREKLERDLRRFRGGGEKWGAEAFMYSEIGERATRRDVRVMDPFPGPTSKFADLRVHPVLGTRARTLPQKGENRMDRQDDRNPLLGLIRLPGLMVVLFVALAGAPSETTARSTCQTYTIEECVSSGSCLEVAGRPCGEQLPGCAGLGWIACGLGNCDGTDVAQVCHFEET